MSIKFTWFPTGVALANKQDITGASTSPIATKFYTREFVIRLPIVASASAQAIAYTSIKGWPTKYAKVVSSAINVITAESTGTTKTVSLGYAGSTTTFVNAQSVATATGIPGAGATVNLAATNLSYTLGSNNFAEAVLEAVLKVECIDS